MELRGLISIIKYFSHNPWSSMFLGRRVRWAFACVGLSGGECGVEGVPADGTFSERKAAPI